MFFFFENVLILDISSVWDVSLRVGRWSGSVK